MGMQQRHFRRGHVPIAIWPPVWYSYLIEIAKKRKKDP